MLPSRATCTRMTSPHRPPFMLLGRVGQPSTRRYGLGRSVGLGYEGCCAPAAPVHVVMATAISRTPARTTHTIKSSRKNAEFYSGKFQSIVSPGRHEIHYHARASALQNVGAHHEEP